MFITRSFNHACRRLSSRDTRFPCVFQLHFSSTSAHNDSALQDEYGEMDDSGETYTIANFRLESGKVIDQVDVRYRTWGELNDKADNALVVCHALTGNASLDSWWGDLLGPGLPFDTNKYFVVCANVLGSCYGSTGPTSINPS